MPCSICMCKILFMQCMILSKAITIAACDCMKCRTMYDNNIVMKGKLVLLTLTIAVNY